MVWPFFGLFWMLKKIILFMVFLVKRKFGFFKTCMCPNLDFLFFLHGNPNFCVPCVSLNCWQVRFEKVRIMWTGKQRIERFKFRESANNFTQLWLMIFFILLWAWNLSLSQLYVLQKCVVQIYVKIQFNKYLGGTLHW